MRASIRAGLAVAAALAALAAATYASARPARQACTAGTRTVGGVTYRTFCGPARATLHVGGKTLRFKGGSCQLLKSTFTINIGTITLPPGSPKYRFFGITVFGKHAGKYRNESVAWQLPHGRRGALTRATITLAKGLKRGTFSGSALPRGKGTGTFSCS